VASVSAALVVNPSASRVTPELILAVERELAARGPVETLLTERPLHAVELVEDAGGRFERIYVFAGDGGYNEAVNGSDGEVPFGFIPGGSTSVLPRALGLPRDPVECARALARSARTRRISLGRVDFFPTTHPRTGSPPRRFTFSAGLGVDAELVRRVDEIGRRDGRRASDVAFARELVGIFGRRRGRFEPAMTVLGRERVAFALVANCDPYSYVGRVPLHVAPQARFELGLDLVAPRRLSAARMPQVAYWVLRGSGQERSRHLLYVHDADEIRIECDGPTPLQMDGEDIGDVTEAHFEAEREALAVIVPE
jgi:diacylglycerol kinase family enzyme